MNDTVSTKLCRFNQSEVFIRDKNLCTELIGQVNFTQMMFFDILGRLPSETEEAVLNAVMVTLMEHGLAPSAITTRLTYASAPEALQGAVAAGLLGAGSVMLGTLEQAAILLEDIVKSADEAASGEVDIAAMEIAAMQVARTFRANKQPIPGFGHPDHRPDDPRCLRLFELAEQLGLSMRYVNASRALSKAVDEVYGKHITLNASAAIAALLCEIKFPQAMMRGIAVVSRSAGLVAHIYDEMHEPIAWTLSAAAEESVNR